MTTGIGWMIGWIGACLGELGGIVGTYVSIRNTNSLRDRALMIKASVAMSIALVSFLGLMLALPNPYRHLLWIPYGILLQCGINRLNGMQRKFRNEDSQSQAA